MTKYSDISTDILNKLASGYTGGGITADKHRQVETSILDFAKSQWRIGDIKEVDCTDDYINLNFETSGPNIGKGKVGGDREGWAICNGNNLTVNLTGRVCIGYGTTPPLGINSFPTVGDTGGSKNAIVVEHTHTYTSPTKNDNVDNYPADNGVCATGTGELITGGATDGVLGTDKNMQPYIVTLFIQKIS